MIKETLEQIQSELGAFLVKAEVAEAEMGDSGSPAEYVDAIKLRLKNKLDGLIVALENLKAAI